jgi:hypothetical protein
VPTGDDGFMMVGFARLSQPTLVDEGRVAVGFAPSDAHPSGANSRNPH